MAGDLQREGWGMCEMVCMSYNKKTVYVEPIVCAGIKFMKIDHRDVRMRRFLLESDVSHSRKLTKLICMIQEARNRAIVPDYGMPMIDNTEHKKRKIKHKVHDLSKEKGVVDVLLPSFQLGEETIDEVRTQIAHSDSCSGVLLKLDIANMHWLFNRLKAMPAEPPKTQSPQAEPNMNDEAGVGGA